MVVEGMEGKSWHLSGAKMGAIQELINLNLLLTDFHATGASKFGGVIIFLYLCSVKQ